ncbi:hypothetical protein ATANTOWER_029143 [Ataeniobius toweri]|uniref:Uncharacterized protein n=1 Tax=Ataeniobius toweri TaxID=208326 RepID=A0ABU7BKU7_9TELE|nr:hypothetical protein [Ataeniobius toweri]
MFDNNLVASVETPFNVFNGSKFQRLIGSIILRLRGEKAQMKLRRTGGQSKHTSFNPVRIHNESNQKEPDGGSTTRTRAAVSCWCQSCRAANS